MTKFAASPYELDLLQSRLRSARRRYAVREMVVALLVACCAGMAAYLAVRIAAQFGMALPGILVPASVGLALVGAIIAGVLRVPSMERLAIAADSAAGGREIFRTAFEWSVRHRPRDVFSERLAQQAERLAERITPNQLVPRVDRALISVTLALAVAIAVATAAWPSVPSNPGTPAGTIEGPELWSIVTELDDIVVRLENEAMARGDQYLMAVSRTLADISAGNADQPLVDRGQLADDLDAIGSHVGAALVQGSSDEGRMLLDQLTQLQQRIEQGDAALLSAGTDPINRSHAQGQGDSALTPEESRAEDVSIEGGVATSTAPGPRQSDIAPEDLPSSPVEGPCQIDGEDSCMGPADTNYSADRSMPIGEAAQALGSTSRSDQDVAGRDGMLIGAASQSGRGDSALAGQGTENLLGPDASQSLDALSEFLTIASDRVAEGSTGMPQERAPERAITVDVGGNLDISSGQWRKLPEQPGDHGAIPAGRRGVLIQYFDRSVED